MKKYDLLIRKGLDVLKEEWLYTCLGYGSLYDIFDIYI